LFVILLLLLLLLLFLCSKVVSDVLWQCGLLQYLEIARVYVALGLYEVTNNVSGELRFM